MVFGDPTMHPRFPADADGDGLPDSTDNCPDIAGSQADWDKDGVGDACDVYPDQPDPDQGLVLVKGKNAVHIQGRACAQGTVSSAINSPMTPFDAESDSSLPPNLWSTYWSKPLQGVGIVPANNIGSGCNLAVWLDMQKSVHYRVGIDYVVHGNAGLLYLRKRT